MDEEAVLKEEERLVNQVGKSRGFLKYLRPVKFQRVRKIRVA